MNTSPLTDPIDAKALQAEPAGNSSYRRTRYGFWGLSVVLFFGLVAFAMLGANTEENVARRELSLFETFAGLLILFVPFVIGLYIAYRLIVKSQATRLEHAFRVRTFAQENGLVYIENHGKDSPKDISTKDTAAVAALVTDVKGAALFGIGTAKRRRQVIGNSQFAMYHYQFASGGGKSKRIHDWQVTVRRLPRKLPHMLFDSRSNNATFFGSNLPQKFDGDQKIDAGVLSRHFDVFVPSDYHIDVLSVIGPDVMEALIQSADASEVEIIDDYLLIYDKTTPNPQSIMAGYTRLQAVIGKLEDNLKHYRDERATTITQRQKIAPRGLRLRKSVWPAVIGVIVLIWYIALRFIAHALDNSVPGVRNWTLAVTFGVAIFFSALAIATGVIKDRR